MWRASSEGVVYQRRLSLRGGSDVVEWVRKWLDLRDRIIEIAKIMRRYPCAKDRLS
jgi:hypothetical protein